MSTSEEPSAPPPASSDSCTVHFAGVRRPLTIALGGDVEHTTVQTFRTKIIEALREAHENPPAYVRILFRGAELAEDSAPLSRYHLANGSTVHAIAAQPPAGAENIDRTMQRTFANIFNMLGNQGEQGTTAAEGQVPAPAVAAAARASRPPAAPAAAPPAAAAPSREEAPADMAEEGEDGNTAPAANTNVWFQQDEQEESMRSRGIASMFVFFMIGFFFGPIAFFLPLFRLESSACVTGIVFNCLKNLFDLFFF